MPEGPTNEGSLMYQALARPCGIEVIVADPIGALSRFYAERTRLADPQLGDLQFKRVSTTAIWIMRKARREELKGATNAE